MHKAPAFLLNLNSTLSFTEDEALAEDIRGQTFTVTNIETLLLNDFYFNFELFTVYELTSQKGNKILLSPFTFEQDDEELKLRITRDLSDEEVKAIFQANTVKQMLSANQDENNYFSIIENEASKKLKDWISRTYYLDIKDQEIASSTYIHYDTGNKKNINYAMLLKKYPANKYFLFLGDYNSFYLEVNFENTPKVRATTFLNLSDIENVQKYISQKEKAAH